MTYRQSTIPRFQDKVSRGVRDASVAFHAGVREFAEQEKVAFRQAILDQEFESFIAFPLSRAYLQRKIAAGADTRVMIATGHYLDSLRIFERDNGDGSFTMLVGFDEDEPAHDLYGRPTDIRLWEVARIHEYGAPLKDPPGDRRIPARPHWGPHLRGMKARAPAARKRIQRKVAEAVRRRMYGGRA